MEYCNLTYQVFRIQVISCRYARSVEHAPEKRHFPVIDFPALLLHAPHFWRQRWMVGELCSFLSPRENTLITFRVWGKLCLECENIHPLYAKILASNYGKKLFLLPAINSIYFIYFYTWVFWNKRKKVFLCTYLLFKLFIFFYLLFFFLFPSIRLSLSLSLSLSRSSTRV